MKATILFAVFLVVIAVSESTKYTINTLNDKVKELCCSGGKKRSEAVEFLSGSRAIRGLWEECCHEGCSFEEIYESHFLYEECVHEGCDNEEIFETC